MLNEMRDVRPCIDRNIQEGRLIITDGRSNSIELYTFFENAFMNANKQGIKKIRVLGDMVWTLEKGKGSMN